MGLPYTASDFICNESVRNAAIGGYNPNRNDVTVVLNIPVCVCDDCGGRNKMVCSWPYKADLADRILQGIKPVPAECFENNFNGGYPVTPTRTNFRVVGGLGIADPGGCETVLCWTTCSNSLRLRQNEARIAGLQLKGIPDRGPSVIPSDEKSHQAYMKQKGFEPIDEFEQETIKNEGGPRKIRNKNPMELSLP